MPPLSHTDVKAMAFRSRARALTVKSCFRQSNIIVQAWCAHHHAEEERTDRILVLVSDIGNGVIGDGTDEIRVKRYASQHGFLFFLFLLWKRYCKNTAAVHIFSYGDRSAVLV